VPGGCCPDGTTTWSNTLTRYLAAGASGAAVAAMRVESRLRSCRWLPDETGIWAVGSGAYFFDLLDTRLDRVR
jgi:hypothetical protein